MKINPFLKKLYYIAGKVLFAIRKRKIDKRFYREGYFLHKVKFEGIKIYYFTNFKKGKNPQKGDIILLHGFLDSSHSFRRIISYLKNDYNVYILDLPGHGKTRVPYIRELWRFSSLVRGTYRFIFEYLQIKKPIFITHSMGGLIVFRMLIYSHLRNEYPEKFNCYLIAIAPGMLHFSRDIREKNMKLFFPSRIEELDELLKNLFQENPPEIPEFIKYYLIQDWNHQGLQYLVKNSLENETEIFFTEELLMNSPCPIKTFFFWGKNDKIVPKDVGEKLAEIIPNSQIFLIENAGHNPHIEQYETLIEILKQILKDLN